MRSVWILGLLGAAGCFGDKAIEMTLEPPSLDVQAAFKTSCVGAVEVYLDGANYASDISDSRRACVDLDENANKSTYTQVREAIQGKLDVKLPGSGLSGIEVFGYAGSCDAPRVADYDLIFFAAEPYIGGDTITLAMKPNLSCEPQDVTIRGVDVLKLVATSQCAMSAWTEGKLALATLSPYPFSDSTDWWGGSSQAPVVGGLATVRGNTKVGPNSCLAIGNLTDDWNAVTCVPPADQRVCAAGAELEAPMVKYSVAMASQSSNLVNQEGGMVIGAVYSAGPVSGAVVTLDEADKALATVVYLDMPAGVETGIGSLIELTGATATNAKGLFAVYTTAMVHVTVTANGKTVRRMIAGNAFDVATAVIVKL
jgi:hypothetical protein